VERSEKAAVKRPSYLPLAAACQPSHRQGLGEAERFKTSCESQSGGKQPLTGELLPRPCRGDVMVAPNGSPKHRATCGT